MRAEILQGGKIRDEEGRGVRSAGGRCAPFRGFLDLAGEWLHQLFRFPRGAATWERLWAMSGVSKAEFWTLTPLEILAKLERVHYAHRWWSMRFAMLVSAQGVTRGKDGPPLSPRDVMEEYFDD